MKMNVSEFAKIAGVSVRTLHYYDEIGVLKPDFVDKNTGYRFYGEVAFKKMQEILFYRELDFSLKDIQIILSSPDYNKEEALESQKQLLILKRNRLDKIIGMLSGDRKGEDTVNFEAFNSNEIDAYRNEVKKRWGETDAYKEHQEKTKTYSLVKWNNIVGRLDGIISKFAENKNDGKSFDSESNLSLVKILQDFITETQYTCTNEILLSLGEMYVKDERFKQNIDKKSTGTAEYMSKAIKEYCKIYM